jgi:X-X-X-Leu-X-X-Gly heptad repeat protein
LFATQARVDEVSSQVRMIKENVEALIDTTADLLHGQQRLETRVKRLEAGQQRLERAFERLDGKVGQLDGKVGQLDTRVGQLDGKVGQLDGKVGQLDGKVGQLDTWVRANLRAVMGHLGVPEVETVAER